MAIVMLPVWHRLTTVTMVGTCHLDPTSSMSG